jgi:hypothetical protein
MFRDDISLVSGKIVVVTGVVGPSDLLAPRAAWTGV